MINRTGAVVQKASFWWADGKGAPTHLTIINKRNLNHKFIIVCLKIHNFS